MRLPLLLQDPRPFVKGLLTWVPGLQGALYDRGSGGSSGSAAYCYGVWLKHLTLLWQHGMAVLPATVLELGPGASLGTGMAALLSGAERHVAIDVTPLAPADTNSRVLQDLVGLFRSRAARPARSWPDYDAYLDERLFPGHILTEERLGHSLAEARLATLADAVKGLEAGAPKPAIRYATWTDPEPLGEGEADLILSHSVLQHVTDLERVYAHCRRWLKPGGFMSHQIDFSAHGVTQAWNGHRQYGQRLWTVVAGRRPYFLNRQPCSDHLALLRDCGFEVVALMRNSRSDGIGRGRLAPMWRHLSDEDLSTSGALIQARRRP
ncbi:MAG TPA: methyltransferase domain-containing protein [Vicinamibacteria bacterium]